MSDRFVIKKNKTNKQKPGIFGYFLEPRMGIKYDWQQEGKVRNVFHPVSCVEPDLTPSIPGNTINAGVSRLSLTSSGILSLSWENSHALASSSTATIFTALPSS